MNSVFQMLLVVPLAEKPSGRIEIDVISRPEPSRIVQDEIFVFSRNKFFVDSGFVRCILAHWLSQDQQLFTEGSE